MLLVKAFLASYLRSEKESRYCKERLDRLQEDCERITPRVFSIGGGSAPSGGGPNDANLANFADLTSEYTERVTETVRLRLEIERFIMRIKRVEYRQILTAIYIDGVQRKNLPQRFRKSRSWCYYTYQRAMNAAQSEFDKRCE